MEKKSRKGCVLLNNSQHIQTVLNGSIHAVKSILPMDIDIQSPNVLSEPYIQNEMGVLIGLLGDLKGRVILDSTPLELGAIGEKMFGMPLEGEMLESFAGELGNMFAGNLCTYLGQHALNVDITPPTVMVGNTKLFGFNKAVKLPTIIHEVGTLTILFTIDEG